MNKSKFLLLISLVVIIFVYYFITLDPFVEKITSINGRWNSQIAADANGGVYHFGSDHGLVYIDKNKNINRVYFELKENNLDWIGGIGIHKNNIYIGFHYKNTELVIYDIDIDNNYAVNTYSYKTPKLSNPEYRITNNNIIYYDRYSHELFIYNQNGLVSQYKFDGNDFADISLEYTPFLGKSSNDLYIAVEGTLLVFLFDNNLKLLNKFKNLPLGEKNMVSPNGRMIVTSNGISIIDLKNNIYYDPIQKDQPFCFPLKCTKSPILLGWSYDSKYIFYTFKDKMFKINVLLYTEGSKRYLFE